MKSYSTVVPGEKMSQFVDLPEDFQKYDLEVVVKPIIKKKQTKSKTSSEAVFLLLGYALIKWGRATGSSC